MFTNIIKIQTKPTIFVIGGLTDIYTLFIRATDILYRILLRGGLLRESSFTGGYQRLWQEG